MKAKEFEAISIRGRVAFGICCLEIYLKSKYPEADFRKVIDLACKITEKGAPIDESTMAFMEIIPEYLFEFDTFEEAEFEYLNESEFKGMIQVMPKDEQLNAIMLAIKDMVWEYCYEAIEIGAPKTFKHLIKIMKIMKECNMACPTSEKFQKYEFGVNSGWGDFISRQEYL